MKKLLLVLLVAMTFMSTTEVKAQQNDMLGEVKIFAGTFVPRGWAYCDGQVLAISQNTALFALIGTEYGGDGRTTFALPDLRGRVAIGQGRGIGLTPVRVGQRGGTELITQRVETITIQQGDTLGINIIQPVVEPLRNRQPFLTLNYIICVNGYFPSRQ
jgi:microcystin-dependent protein